MSPIYKLANKLPRFNIPTTLANGSAGRFGMIDPWLELPGAPWTYAPGQALARGFARTCGSPYAQAVVSTQNFGGVVVNNMLGYIEIAELQGRLIVDAIDKAFFTEPGNYLFELYRSNQGDALVGFSWFEYYINDPLFKFIPFGQFLTLAQRTAVAYQGWCTLDTPAAVVKNDNGNIALNLSYGTGASLIFLSPWAASNAVKVELDVQSMPIGAQINILTASGATALAITAAGSYTVEVTMGVGENLTVVPAATMQGQVIITRMMAKYPTVAFTAEIPYQSARLTAFTVQEKSKFESILNPAFAYASARFDKPNLNGFVPTPNEPLLGYGSMPPPSGLFRVGDTVRNNNAILGAVSGWRCTAAGNPGTWMPLATL